MAKNNSQPDPPAFTSESSKYIRRLMRDVSSIIDDNSIREIDEAIQDIANDPSLLEDHLRDELIEIVSLIDEQADDNLCELLRTDGTFNLTVSDNQMFMLLTVNPPIAGGNPVTLDAVVEELKRRGIKYGVDVRQITRALRVAAGGEAVRDATIVRGILAEEGTNGSIIFFGRRTLNESLERFSGDDFGLLPANSLFCKENDVIATILEPIPGKPGYNATGGFLAPMPVTPAKLEPGDNVELVNGQIYATTTGVIQFTHEKISVSRLLLIPNDVIKQKCPIEFEGDVYIKGAVRSGSFIKATGNIHVDCVVEGATMISTAGSIHLRSGVAGQHTAVIRAKVDIIAKYCENAVLVAYRTIDLSAGSLNCHLIAGEEIIALRDKGRIVGGHAIAGKKISAKQFGAPGNASTSLVVGISTDAIENASALEEKMNYYRNKYNDCNDIVNTIRRAVPDLRQLGKEERQYVVKLLELRIVCAQKIKAVSKELEHLENDHTNVAAAVVNSMGAMFPNVSISIANAIYHNTANRRSCTVTYDSHEEKIVVK